MVIVKRGIPGSGKSHSVMEKIKEWKSSFLVVKVFSTDNFWLDEDGRYKFDSRRLQEAHNWCLRNYLEALRQLEKGYPNEKQDASLFVVDNTNLRAAEAAPYMALASVFGHTPVIHNHYCPPELAFKRNTHGLNLGSILKMYKTFIDEDIPPWWKSLYFDQDGNY
jgi:predicted kinase